MLGAIIGDIVGSRFEFNNNRTKEFELFTSDCFVTDDSIMTLAIAKAVMETEKHMPFPKPGDMSEGADDSYDILGRLSVRYMQELGRKYPNCGFGGMFYKWVFNDDPEPYNSYGNGAAMRVSSVGYAAHIGSDVVRLAEIVTEVTHDHPEGIKGAQAVAEAVFMARRGTLKSDIRKNMERYYDLNFTIDSIRDSYKFNETCQETVPQAIAAFLESNSFEDAIRIAISVGGDSDTLAAITGSIAEAYYGVPDDIRKKALAYLDDDLRAIFDEWEDVYCYSRDRKWQKSISPDDILKVSFNIGGFHDGYTYYNYDFSKDDTIFSVSGWNTASLEKILSADKKSELQQKFYDLHTEYWNHDYHPIDMCVLDGTQWSFSITYRNGQTLVYEGDNAYPENWDVVLNIFKIYLTF